MANIVEEYKWTTATGESVKKEAPRIRAIPYEIDQNDIVNRIKNWGSQLGSGGKQYYDELYKAKAGQGWTFPFFSDTVRSFQNAWGDQYVGSTNGSQAFGAQYAGEITKFMDSLAATKGQVTAMAAGKPGALIEPPKYYQYSVDEDAVNFDFYLINTDDSPNEGGEPSWKKNYELVKELIVLNRFTREKANTIAIPPRLWQVWVSGYRHIRWASMSINIELLGMRLMKEKKIIPEGYRIIVSLTPLFTEPSNYKDQYDLA